MSTTTTTPPIVQTIMKQLGNGTIMMLGATMFSYSDERTLSFRIKGSPKSVNHIIISLNANDTYKMVFGRIHGMKYRIIRTVEECYANSMHELIEETTYLRTQVPKIIFN